MKRISLIIFFVLIFSSVLFGDKSFSYPGSEPILFLKPINFERVVPKMAVEVFVKYPDSEPVIYFGKTVANFDDALLISANDKIYYIRKKFIERLVIFSGKNTPLIAMTE